jgi:general secretion pathway protein I
MSRTASIRVAGLSARRQGEQGFALLEILVAFVILALGLGAISTGVALAMRSDGRTQTGRVAFRVAQSRLEAAGFTEPLVPGHREGQIANNFRWQETITAVHIGTELPDTPSLKLGQIASRAGIAPFWVEIAVQAPDGTVARLAALKLASGTKQ